MQAPSWDIGEKLVRIPEAEGTEIPMSGTIECPSPELRPFQPNDLPPSSLHR